MTLIELIRNMSYAFSKNSVQNYVIHAIKKVVHSYSINVFRLVEMPSCFNWSYKLLKISNFKRD